MNEAMGWVHRRRLQLHLQLFATLPKSLYGVFESDAALCISVHVSVSIHVPRVLSDIPRHALNELPHHILNALILLEALQQWLFC